jgi:hypothetical protein
MEAAKKKMSKLATLSIIIFLISACVSKYERDKENALKGVREKYSCISVDDCLSKYDFEAARAFMGADEFSEYENLRKIVEAESIYFAKNGDYERAISVIDEADMSHYIEEDIQKMKFKIYEISVNSFLEKGDYDNAKKWAMRSSDIHSTNGRTKEIYDHYGYKWTKDITQRGNLLAKIKEYKKTIEE